MVKRNDRWSALSMKERAEVFKIGIDNGITDRNTIINLYENGGEKEPLYYDNTPIEPAVVKAFKSQEDYNRFLGEKGAKAVREGTNRVAQNIFKGLQYVPVVGDGIDVADMTASLQEGNITKAVSLAGLALLPNALENAGKAVIRPFKNYKRISRMKESFTGVPHRATYQDGHVTMDDNFHKYNGTIWTTDSPELARQYAEGNGKVFKVLVEPDKLKMLETPTPNKKEYFPWGHLPYRLNGDKIEFTDYELKESQIFDSIEDGLAFSKTVNNPNRTPEGVRKALEKSLTAKIGGTTTDDIVNQSYINGFDGVNFYGIYDGYRMIDGNPVDVINNESVYNPHVPHLVLPENKSKWSLLFKDLNDLTILKNGGKLLTK